MDIFNRPIYWSENLSHRYILPHVWDRLWSMTKSHWYYSPTTLKKALTNKAPLFLCGGMYILKSLFPLFPFVGVITNKQATSPPPFQGVTTLKQSANGEANDEVQLKKYID